MDAVLELSVLLSLKYNCVLLVLSCGNFHPSLLSVFVQFDSDDDSVLKLLKVKQLKAADSLWKLNRVLFYIYLCFLSLRLWLFDTNLHMFELMIDTDPTNQVREHSCSDPIGGWEEGPDQPERLMREETKQDVVEKQGEGQRGGTSSTETGDRPKDSLVPSVLLSHLVRTCCFSFLLPSSRSFPANMCHQRDVQVMSVKHFYVLWTSKHVTGTPKYLSI